MDRSKLIAILTGAISLILAIAYLIIVQLLDFRGEMLPAPQSQIPQSVVVAHNYQTILLIRTPDIPHLSG